MNNQEKETNKFLIWESQLRAASTITLRNVNCKGSQSHPK